MLKMLLGQTYADRDTKTIAVQDGQKNWKQACASFVSKDTDLILQNYFAKIHNNIYIYIYIYIYN